MKRACILILTCVLAAVNTAVAQDGEDSPKRNTYLNVGYVFQQLKGVDNNMLFNSDYGVSFSIGHTYYLHRKPIANLMKVGLDATFFDLNVADYTDYNSRHYNDGEDSDRTMQIAAGMQIGPSLTFFPPVNELKGHLYVRYAPSFSGIVANEDLYANYAGFWLSGLAVSYKMISAGMELRWGSANYKTGDEVKEKWQTRATRYYVSFRF
ncbi:hypothetical protein [Parabacteroides sp. PF5-9]|uniref:hypothetical protein n=1 Tax=Parabacteroides sp. PF5-9 TaxID=1742404 RepID=UPI0024744A7D|nr:hypothetical protein [Parabacteroides sp. PF5-9]MDH6358790.1 hypothetical protein [Parabacteroides sp. PF5-9]